MNFLKLLTSKRGAVNKARLLMLGATGTAAFVTLSGSYQHDVKKYTPERLTFAGIVDDGGAYSGTAMDFSDNRGVVLSAGGKTGDGARYLNESNLDNMSSRLGSAFGTSEGDGLVQDSDIDTGTAGGSSGRMSGGPDSYASRAAAAAAEVSGAPGGAGGIGSQSMGRASMARASGGSSGSSNSYTPGAGSSGRGDNSQGNYHLSGSMSSLGDANTVDNALASARSNAVFGSRGADVRTGNRTVTEKGEGLAGIARYSAKVAAQGNKTSANAQAGAFLNGQKAAVGGISFGAAGGEKGGSSDLSAASIKKGTQGIKKFADDKKAYAKRLAKARKKLAVHLAIFLAAAVAAAVAIYYLCKIKPWGKFAALGVWAGIGVYAGITIAECVKFQHQWKGDAGALPVSGSILAGAAILACGYIWLTSGAGVSFGGGGGGTNILTSSLKGAAMGKVTGAAEDVITTASSKEGK